MPNDVTTIDYKTIRVAEQTTVDALHEVLETVLARLDDLEAPKAKAPSKPKVSKEEPVADEKESK